MMQTTSSSLTDRLMGVVTFKAPVYKDIAHDPAALQPAAIIVVAVAVISAVVSGLLSGAGIVFGLITAVLAVLLGWVVGSWLTAFVAKQFFQGQTNTGEMLRILGHTYIFQIVSIIPIIGGLIALVLNIIATIIAIREAASLDNTKALLTAIIVNVIVFVATLIIGGVIAGLFIAGAAVTGNLQQ